MQDYKRKMLYLRGWEIHLAQLAQPDGSHQPGHKPQPDGSHSPGPQPQPSCLIVVVYLAHSMVKALLIASLISGLNAYSSLEIRE